mgnify:CR=1 FL=1
MGQPQFPRRWQHIRDPAAADAEDVGRGGRRDVPRRRALRLRAPERRRVADEDLLQAGGEAEDRRRAGAGVS